MVYRMNVAGLERDLPICKVTDSLYIAGFVIFGDQELTVACARELLKRAIYKESVTLQIGRSLSRPATFIR